MINFAPIIFNLKMINTVTNIILYVTSDQILFFVFFLFLRLLFKCNIFPFPLLLPNPPYSPPHLLYRLFFFVIVYISVYISIYILLFFSKMIIQHWTTYWIFPGKVTSPISRFPHLFIFLW